MQLRREVSQTAIRSKEKTTKSGPGSAKHSHPSSTCSRVSQWLIFAFLVWYHRHPPPAETSFGLHSSSVNSLVTRSIDHPLGSRSGVFCGTSLPLGLTALTYFTSKATSLRRGPKPSCWCWSYCHFSLGALLGSNRDREVTVPKCAPHWLSLH